MILFGEFSKLMEEKKPMRALQNYGPDRFHRSLNPNQMFIKNRNIVLNKLKFSFKTNMFRSF